MMTDGTSHNGRAHETCREIFLLARDHSSFKRTDRYEWFLTRTFLTEDVDDAEESSRPAADSDQEHNDLCLWPMEQCYARSLRDGDKSDRPDSCLKVLCASSESGKYYADEDLFSDNKSFLKFAGREV